MSSTARLILAIFVALVVVMVGAVWWWLSSREAPEEAVATVGEPTPVPSPSPTPGLQERLSERLAGTTLSTSDAVVRELVAGLSSRPELATWLVNEDLVRRFVAAVNGIAAGRSPRAQFDFLRPKEGFEVDETGGGALVIEESSYDRYDAVAAVVASIDVEGTAALYRELEPLIDEAYAEIGPRNARFSDRLDAAFDQLLAVPVLEGPVEVEQLVLTYAWTDPTLEGMSDAQRHLLRMGPDNVATIQNVLGELRAELADNPSD
jgi:hypothetical protein